MEMLNSNPILKFNNEQISKVRKSLGYEDVAVLKKDIQELHDWIQKQDHFQVKEFDINYLERWLIMNKGNVERAKRKFDGLCTNITQMPEFLQNYDVKNEFKAIFTVSHHVILPKPSSDNYRILVAHLTGETHKDYKVIHTFRYYTMCLQYMLQHDYCCGIEWVVDLRLLAWGVITKINPVVIRKAVKIFLEGLSCRIKRIHMISGFKLFNIALMVIKQGLSAKLRDRILIHSDVESLYEHIPREHLPKELGGEERSIKEISDDVFKELCTDENIENMKYMSSAGVDESKRVPS